MKLHSTLVGMLGVTLAAGVAAADAPRDLNDYVVFGVVEVRVDDGAFIARGHVGVNDPSGELQLERRVSVADGSAAVADHVRLGKATSIFDVFANSLSGTGAVIRGTGPTPFAAPIVLALPPLPGFAPGATSVIVRRAREAVVAPGAYDVLQVGDDARVVLTGGAYEFATFEVGKRAKLLVAAPSTINVRDTLAVGRFTAFGPADASVPAREIAVNVGGADVGFGAAAHAVIDLLAPNADVRFGRSFRGRGRFIGRTIHLGNTTNVRAPACAGGMPPTDCDDESPAAPASFCTLSKATYGAADGDANGAAGLVTANPDVLPLTIGAPGIRSLTVPDQARLVCFLPAAAPAASICANGGCGGDVTIDACSNPPIVDFVPDGDGSSGGQGAGALAGQTIAAKLNVALSKRGATPAGLGRLILPSRLCTTKCPAGREIDPISMKAQKAAAGIANGLTSVDDLLALADQGLSQPCRVGTCERSDRNAFAPPDPIRLSAIAIALGVVNDCFEGCATIVPCP